MSTSIQEAISVAYIIGSGLGFILFIIYDMNSIKWRSKVLNQLFYLGCLLIIVNTFGALYSIRAAIEMNLISQVLWIPTIVFFFILLIYTLFFALPFESTYVENHNVRQTYTNGIYALCRHPGVLWFIGLYFSLFFLTGSTIMLYMAIVLSTLNFGYIIFQDLWTFPRMFSDYNEYKENLSLIHI